MSAASLDLLDLPDFRVKWDRKVTEVTPVWSALLWESEDHPAPLGPQELKDTLALLVPKERKVYLVLLAGSVNQVVKAPQV